MGDAVAAVPDSSERLSRQLQLGHPAALTSAPCTSVRLPDAMAAAIMAAPGTCTGAPAESTAPGTIALPLASCAAGSSEASNPFAGIILNFSGQGSIFSSCGVGSGVPADGGEIGVRVAGAIDTLGRRTVLRRRRPAVGDALTAFPDSLEQPSWPLQLQTYPDDGAWVTGSSCPPPVPGPALSSAEAWMRACAIECASILAVFGAGSTDEAPAWAAPFGGAAWQPYDRACCSGR